MRQQSREKRAEIRNELAAAILRHKHDPRPDLRRLEPRKRPPKSRKLVAYDFETTRIQPGTPAPLYLTAHGADFSVDTRVRDMTHVTQLLRTYFLTDEMLGTSYVAWNANRFDAYFIASALIREADFVLTPFLTKSKALRGLRVVRAADRDKRNAKSWLFLDGIAMTGLAGVKLEEFIRTFAPEFPKLTGSIDFETEEFDPENEKHRTYAYRDSEGLYHAISHAQRIMLDTFDEPLSITMGGACIKILQRHIPPDTVVDSLIPDVAEIVHSQVMRGGFCYLARRYKGPIWKYDINQAYAAAMREADLPCGGALRVRGKPDSRSSVYIAQISATHESNIIPMYHRAMIDGRLRSMFSTREINHAWFTSIEMQQLAREGWTIKYHDSWVWPASFRLTEYVDRLERLRTTCDGGPKGAIGTMVKATGNHSFGKSAEQILPIEYILAAECPPDCVPYYGDGSDPIEHVYYRIDDDRKPKAYHQPHIAAWITAHVRMVVRRAALLAPESWLYADTDCVVFACDVTSRLDIDSARYGAWKVEESGTVYKLIAKKVYSQVGGEKPKRSAKGLHVNKLSDADFSAWFDGTPPVQKQTQVQNFLTVLHGSDMFKQQTRKGTRIESAII